MIKRQIVWLVLIVGLAAMAAWFMRPPKATAPTTKLNLSNANRNQSTTTGTIPFSTADLPDRDPSLTFRLTTPDTWAAQYISGPKAIVFYTPTAHSNDPSTVHVVISEASTLPSTPSQTTSTIDGQTAQWFHQASTVADNELPAWLTEAHNEVWLAVKNRSGAYYVVAQSPTLDDQTFTTLVTSFHFDQTIPTTPTTLN